MLRTQFFDRRGQPFPFFVGLGYQGRILAYSGRGISTAEESRQLIAGGILELKLIE